MRALLAAFFIYLASLSPVEAQNLWPVPVEGAVIDDRYPHLRLPEAYATARAWPQKQTKRDRSSSVTQRRSLFAGLVDEAAAAAGVPRHIAHAVIRIESGYNARARSRSGAIGLGQILCRTARGVGFSGSCHQLYEPRTNLAYSMKYLRLALNRGGHGCAGIGLYERGIYAKPRCTRYGRMVMTGA